MKMIWLAPLGSDTRMKELGCCPKYRFNMGKVLLLLLLLLSSRCRMSAQDTVAFYFAAHEDDWQLFMNPNAYQDVQRTSTKVVFVYLTAGDAGAGLGNGERSQPY